MTTPNLPSGPQETPQDAPGATSGPESGSSLRAKLEASQAELREMKTRALDDAFSRNGLSRTEGVGKAFAAGYDGEPTQEAVAEFLHTEYGYEPEPEAHPYAQAITRGQAELDRLQQTGGSVAPLTQADELARAESRGDHSTAMAIKSQQVADMFRGISG